MNIFSAVIYITVFCLGLPANCWALYRLYRLFQSGSRVSVYIVNLLLADLLQLATLPTMINILLKNVFPGYAIIRNQSLLCVSQGSSAGFLVLISLERYLAISCSIWYHRIQPLRRALPIALGVWGLCSFFLVLYTLSNLVAIHTKGVLIFSCIAIFYLLPLVLLVFSCIGTWRALARAASVPDTERRRAVWMVAFTLLIFTVAYSTFWATFLIRTASDHVFTLSLSLLSLTVVLAPLLCLFLRESPRDTGDCGTEQRDTREEEMVNEVASSV